MSDSPPRAGLADTSLFIAREAARPLAEHLLPERLAVSVITVGELHAGVLAASDVATRDRRLATLEAVRRLDPLPIDERVASAWARLRVELRDAGRRMPVNDAWIAATALAWDLALLTQDHDYAAVAGLDVISV